MPDLFGGGGDGGTSTTTTQTNTQATNVEVITNLSSGPVSIAPKVDVYAPIDLRPNIALDLRPTIGVSLQVANDFLRPIADTYAPIAAALSKSLGDNTESTRTALAIIAAQASGSLTTIQNAAGKVTEANREATAETKASLMAANQLNADLRRLVSYQPATLTGPGIPTIDQATMLKAAGLIMAAILLLRMMHAHG